MALHAREIARCATTAMARQIQICAHRQTPLSASTRPQIVQARSITNGSSLNGGVARGGGPGRGGHSLEEGGNANMKGESGKVRIKYATPEKVLAQQRFLPEYARPLSRKAAKEPLGKYARNVRQKSELADKDVGIGRNNNKGKLSPITKEGLKEGPASASTKPSAGLRFHRKEDQSIDLSRAGKFQKKIDSKERIQSNLTKPVSKIARDINHWFNEVVEHIAKAEEAAASAAKRNGAPKCNNKTSSRGGVPPKSDSGTKSCGNITNNKSSTPRHNKQTTSKATTKRSLGWVDIAGTTKENKNAHIQAWKPKAAATWGAENTLGSNNFRRNLELQLSVLNADIERHHDKSRESQAHSGPHIERHHDKSRESQAQFGPQSGQDRGLDALNPAGKPRKMIEIKPSLVENSETFSPLASTAGWYPYGSPSNNLLETPPVVNSNRGGERSRITKPAKGTATAAMVGSNVVSGSSKHKLASNSASNIIKSSSRASIEKGKGFVLLSNKDKAKEAKENATRKAQPKTKLQPVSAQRSKNSSFILVDSIEDRIIQDVRSKGVRVNRLLSDNPHVAAANRSKQETVSKFPAKVVKQTPSGASLNEIIGKYKVDQSQTKDKMSILEKFYLETGPKQKSKAGSDAMEFSTTDQYARKWSEKVEQKLCEIRAAKQKSASPDVTKEPRANKTTFNEFVSEQAAFGHGTSAIVNKKCTQIQKNATNKPTTDQKVSQQDRLGETTSDNHRSFTGGEAVSHPLFGPLTKEQHGLLEQIQNAGKSKKKNTTANSLALKSKSEVPTDSVLVTTAKSKPIVVKELKPDVKSMTKKTESTREPSRQKSEPILVVAPEELVTTKTPKVPKSTSAASSNELWSNVIQERMKQYEALLRLEMDKKNKKSNEVAPNSSSKTKENQEATNKESRYALNTVGDSKRRSKSKESKVEQKKNKGKTSNSKQKRASLYMSKSDTNVEPALKIFQEQFLKEQHKKLIRSQKLKTKSIKPEGGKVVDPVVSTPEPKATTALVKSNGNGVAAETNLPPLAQSSLSHGSPKVSTTANVSKDLDPFEAWIKQMEDIGSTNKTKAPDMETNTPTQIEQAELKKSPREKSQERKKKQKYPRFETTPRSDMAQEMYRDFRTTYTHQTINTSPTSAEPTSRNSQLKRPNIPNKKMYMNESDRLYNMIKKGSRNPSNISPISLIVPAQRSKVLTQSGLGTVTDSRTGIVDPRRMPKLGNLFSSLDGFIAMDAVPVLDDPVVKSSDSGSKLETANTAQKETTASKASGDGLKGDDMRAILAREREAASASARRRMIEAYEKNIEKYEKGLEVYRSKLREARQSAMESEKPKSDNPRRDDL